MTIQNVKLGAKEKRTLLKLARKAIESRARGQNPKTDKEEITEKLEQKRGTFVTLTIGGKLRGCIGHILPAQELYKDVIENARSAAFDDGRFSPLNKEEFKKIKIEISILGLAKKFEYKDTKELINYLSKNKPGVILKKGLRQSTFLPQVWESADSAEDFLSHLCLKAGLPRDEWTRGVEIALYNTLTFS